jgi:hypothetical protein
LFRVFESSARCKSAFFGHWLKAKFVVKFSQVCGQVFYSQHVLHNNRAYRLTAVSRDEKQEEEK